MNISPSEQIEAQKQEIITYVRNFIREHGLEENDRLPSENFLAEKFRINRNTVRGALQVLKGQGLIYSVKGKGFFVAEKPSPLVYRHDNSLGFSEILNNGTRKFTSVALSTQLKRASEEEAHKLQIAVGDAVYHLKQLRSINGKKLAVCLSVIPAQLVPKLEEHTENFSGVNNILMNVYQFPHPICKWVQIKASLPSPEEMEMLAITGNIPILEQRNLFAVEGERPIEYFIVRARGDMFHFSMEFR